MDEARGEDETILQFPIRREHREATAATYKARCTPSVTDRSPLSPDWNNSPPPPRKQEDENFRAVFHNASIIVEREFKEPCHSLAVLD